MSLWLSLMFAAVVAVPFQAQEGPAAETYRVDPARSRIVIIVGKSGLFSFLAGHEHEVETRGVEGVVHRDSQDPTRSTLALSVAAESLRVTGKGEPADDVPEVQEVMQSDEVLDVERYPTISFESTGIAHGDEAAEFIVTGRLTLHGTTRSVEVPVHVELDGDTLTATGNTTLKQTDYGIKPVSVAGVVKVKDEVAISFTIVATSAPAPLR